MRLLLVEDSIPIQDASRTGGAHSGLGLPLARSSAGLLGFELTATLTHPDRLSLTLSEPMQTSQPSSGRPTHRNLLFCHGGRVRELGGQIKQNGGELPHRLGQLIQDSGRCQIEPGQGFEPICGDTPAR